MVVGRIAGAFGVRGWVKLLSFTDPVENLVHYGGWRLARAAEDPAGARDVVLAEWQWHGDRLIGRLEGVTDRDVAERLTGLEIRVPRGELPTPAAGEFYWADLMGFAVRNLEGAALGRLEDVMDNGAQDVMVVRGAGRERLIPFVRGPIVHRVDAQARVIDVDWGEDY